MIPDSKLTWFPFNPSEFLTRIIGLPNQSVGAYIKLLSYSWVNGPIPNDPRVLASIAGKGDMELITARFFEVNEDGKLYDPRLEDSRLKAAEMLEANRKRTLKASAKRWPSPSPSPDASVTETEDNDRTTIGPEIKGPEIKDSPLRAAGPLAQAKSPTVLDMSSEAQKLRVKEHVRRWQEEKSKSIPQAA